MLGTLPEDGAVDVLVASYDDSTEEERRILVQAFANGARAKTRLLLVSAGQKHEEFASLFGQRCATNLLAKNGEVDPHDLIVTVQKIVRRDVFGIEKYFVWGVEAVVTRLTRSSEKADLLTKAEAYATNIGVSGRLVTQFCTVADELFTNAIYNAPIDADGRSRWAHMPRKDEVVLAPGEEVVVRFCSDGSRLGISTTDPFGSLTPERLFDYLAKCFRGGVDQIDDKPGGAGLGLYYIFDAVSHMVVNIASGERTEMIGLLDVRGSYKDFARRGKSFNIFTSD